MQKYLWLVRHGETDFNKNRIIQGGGMNPSLNLNGRCQSLRLYEAYKDQSFDLLIASSLRRTRQTLLPFESQDNHIVLTALIDEMSWGIHEGKKYAPWMEKNYDKLMRAWANQNYLQSLPGGESAQSLRDRCQIFLEKVVSRPETNILICSHGRTMRCLMTILAGEELRCMEKYDHANTGLFRAKWDGDEFHILGLNDTSHLD